MEPQISHRETHQNKNKIRSIFDQNNDSKKVISNKSGKKNQKESKNKYFQEVEKLESVGLSDPEN